MANGFSTEQIIEMMYNEFKEFRREVTANLKDLKDNGCSHRASSEDRIKSLEDSRKIGIVGMLAASGAFIKAFFIK